MNTAQNSEAEDDELLTVAKLCQYPGCEHYTDEEAKKVVQSLHQLSEILLRIPEIKNHLIDNQYVVYLNTATNKAA
ncbi:MAG: hypothetical protein JNM68_06365 [Dinghuibacter sp.]|nr:hypothetical protein [Dinghuibacter sp.]